MDIRTGNVTHYLDYARRVMSKSLQQQDEMPLRGIIEQPLWRDS